MESDLLSGPTGASELLVGNQGLMSIGAD